MRHLTTNSNRRLIGAMFSERLKDLLAKKYGFMPSAAKFADAFNLRAHGTTTISRETARKWLRGEAIPELSRLRVLITWLGLKPADFLDPELTNTFVEKSSVPSPEINLNELTHSKLLGLLNELDEKSIEALFLAAWALRELKNIRANGVTFPPRLRFPE